MPELLAKLNDGRDLPVNTCHCGHCDNEWFMVALSDEWMPSHCPYCGTKFKRKAEGLYLPAPDNANNEIQRLEKKVSDLRVSHMNALAEERRQRALYRAEFVRAEKLAERLSGFEEKIQKLDGAFTAPSREWLSEMAELTGSDPCSVGSPDKFTCGTCNRELPWEDVLPFPADDTLKCRRCAGYQPFRKIMFGVYPEDGFADDVSALFTSQEAADLYAPDGWVVLRTEVDGEAFNHEVR